MNETLHEYLTDLGWLLVELAILMVFFAFFEKIKPSQKKLKFFKADFKKELGIALLNGSIFTPIFTLGFTFILVTYLNDWIPNQVFDSYITLLPIALQVLLGAFIIDLGTYARHRFTHRYVWNYHAIHHSAEEINWLTAFRLHPFEVLIATIVDVTVLHVLGFSGPGILFAMLFVHFYNFFAHANIDLEYGSPVRYIFASPNYHRWHHATDKKAYDKNFCAVFSCIDLMFGTFYHPQGTLPEAYGLSPKEQAIVPKGILAHLLHPMKQARNKRKKKS